MDANAAFEPTPAYPEQAGANEYASEYVESGGSEYPKQVGADSARSSEQALGSEDASSSSGPPA